MGAPVGNTNRADNKRWRMALDAALEKRGKDKAEALADLAAKLLDKASEGDISALKEIGDRFDGKPTQQVNLADADGDKLQVSLVINGLTNAGG